MCSCRDLPDKPHMKDFFDLLMDAVPHLDEPLYRLGDKSVAPGKGQSDQRRRAEAPASAATQPPATGKKTAKKPARRKEGAVEPVAGPPESGLVTVVRVLMQC